MHSSTVSTLRRLDSSAFGPTTRAVQATIPRDLLKLYIYGYLNRIRSSRRLETETHRNLEAIWLLRQLKPDFKTIADFRRDNRHAFRAVFRRFVRLCRELDLYGRELIAVDGTRIKAVNHRDRNFTRAKLKTDLQRIDDRLDRYLDQVNEADADDAGGRAATVAPGSTVYTDGLKGFEGIPAADVQHVPRPQPRRTELRKGVPSVVPLADRAIGNLQQWLIGTYHGVSKAQLQVYLDEFVFRHNRRRATDGRLSNIARPRYGKASDDLSPHSRSPGRREPWAVVTTCWGLLNKPYKQETPNRDALFAAVRHPSALDAYPRGDAVFLPVAHPFPIIRFTTHVKALFLNPAFACSAALQVFVGRVEEAVASILVEIRPAVPRCLTR